MTYKRNAKSKGLQLNRYNRLKRGIILKKSVYFVYSIIKNWNKKHIYKNIFGLLIHKVH